MLLLILRNRQIIMRERFPWEIFSCYQMRIEMRKLIFVILSVSLRCQNFFHNQKALLERTDIFLSWKCFFAVKYRIHAYATSKLIAPACLLFAGLSLTSERYRSGYFSWAISTAACITIAMLVGEWFFLILSKAIGKAFSNADSTDLLLLLSQK